MGWEDEDEVVTTFRTIKQSQAEAYAEAMSVVEGIIEEMISSGFDYTTLEELQQRIR
jgi:hypothetical protein